MNNCSHKYVYGGIKYKPRPQPVDFTNIHLVDYYDWFFCEKCLHNVYEKLDSVAHTNEPPMFNATPIHDDPTIPHRTIP
jgi:hypothetical protein